MKFKLSKASWFILAAGIFMVILIGLGLTRSQQIQSKSRLDEELSKAEMRLNTLQVKQLSEQQSELQKKLNESIKNLNEAKDNLRQTIESIDVSDEFFFVAQDSNVVINSLTSSSIRKEKLDGINLAEITVNAMAKGAVDDLINFVIQLNSNFPTGIVRSAQLSIPEGDDEDEPSANIMMVVYSYEGD
ncbi:MAG: hypothetical protein A2144_06005 [Chloroflexi bacterium RBG_16_50_9]|nr:MAG: hypothetical protein A2144_06005 [Chloroflexi bacterium RBG_16_50_9]